MLLQFKRRDLLETKSLLCPFFPPCVTAHVGATAVTVGFRVGSRASESCGGSRAAGKFPSTCLQADQNKDGDWLQPPRHANEPGEGVGVEVEVRTGAGRVGVGACLGARFMRALFTTPPRPLPPPSHHHLRGGGVCSAEVETGW